MGMIAFNTNRGDPFGHASGSALASAWRFRCWLFISCVFFPAEIGFAQDTTPPRLVFHSISIQLDSAGHHTLTVGEIARIAAGSSDPSGITNAKVTPDTFSFCDAGTQTITLSLTDAHNNATNQTGAISVLAPTAAPHEVYADSTYPSACGPASFPNGGPDASHFIGLDAFRTIQAAVDHVGQNGIVHVAAGSYVENVVVTRPLCLLGPNAGTPGSVANRRPEAMVIPQRSDPENASIISVESDDVVIDGLFLDGSNPSLTGGYNANGVRVHAAAGIQNGTYPDLADVEGMTIRNNIVANISYDGICLDRYQYFGTSSAWNYIRNNKLANMWEGMLTYALDSVITGNVISNVTHGLSVHCVTTSSPKGFIPLVSSNTLTIGQWWPVEIQAARAPGIWINYRRERASPITVMGNVVNTPTASPSLKTIIGLFALTVDGNGTIDFTDNTVAGTGNCTVGFLAASCWSNNAVRLLGGSLKNIHSTGVLAGTLDAKWGPGNSSVTISNVEISLSPGGVGVLALQEPGTTLNSAFVNVTSNTSIHGGACGVQVRGANASASVVGTAQPIYANDVGIYVDSGRALVEGNLLTSNRFAAIVVENNGVVDAGDCSGANITGLGSGNGLNGASAGLNTLSGFGFDKLAPWAIHNSGGIPVLADRNIFKAAEGENIRDAIHGPVSFSETGILSVSAPPAMQVECIGQVPVAAQTMEEFVAAGGVVTAGSVSRVSSSETIVTNRPGHYTLTRCYTVEGGCSQAASCNQIITARDDQGPTLHCSSNIVQGVDPGCDYATVTFTNLAADSCGELAGPWVPVSTGRFPIGTNTVIVIATDAANNSAACSFDVAVIRPPTITEQPLARTNNAGTTATFKVAATGTAPLSFRWKKNEVPVVDGGRISGGSGAELTLAAVTESDAADYSVDVSNLAGVASSAKARLSLVTPRGLLRVMDFSGGVVTLELSGPVACTFAILTSTNLSDWAELYTNTAPFTFTHTNATAPGCRFYRAFHLP